MGILDRVKAKQAERRVEGERKKVEREAEQARQEVLAQERAHVAAEQEREAREIAERDRMVQILGPDLAEMDVKTPDEAKIAVKLARLRKKEIQGEKRELAAELADVREEWRDRQAGRISTVGLGRGTGGRMVRAGIQSKRRGERMEHAGVVNQHSDRRQDLDSQINVIDRFILDLERKALK